MHRFRQGARAIVDVTALRRPFHRPWIEAFSVFQWLSAPRVVDTVRSTDFETMEEIHAASFRSFWGADEQAAMARAPGVITLVARRGSATASRRPVGFITVRHAADEAEVLTMAVHPRHRRSGIGAMLLNGALKRLEAERIDNVFLEVDPHNRAALALYRRRGFVPVGERPDYYANGGTPGERQSALTMRLSPIRSGGGLGLPSGGLTV